MCLEHMAVEAKDRTAERLVLDQAGKRALVGDHNSGAGEPVTNRVRGLGEDGQRHIEKGPLDEGGDLPRRTTADCAPVSDCPPARPARRSRARPHALRGRSGDRQVPPPHACRRPRARSSGRADAPPGGSGRRSPGRVRSGCRAHRREDVSSCPGRALRALAAARRRGDRRTHRPSACAAASTRVSIAAGQSATCRRNGIVDRRRSTVQRNHSRPGGRRPLRPRPPSASSRAAGRSSSPRTIEETYVAMSSAGGDMQVESKSITA